MATLSKGTWMSFQTRCQRSFSHGTQRINSVRIKLISIIQASQ